MTFFKSVKSSDKSLELQQELVEMLNKAAFHLIKWISNEKEVIEQIPESERVPSIKVVEESIVMPMERALGVVWDTSSDCFVYEVVKRDIADTRRKILSLIASLFDPIGFLAPFLVRAKIFLQQVWQLGIGWDDTLPPEFLKEWSKWQEELDGIAQFRIPHFYHHIPDNPSVIVNGPAFLHLPEERWPREMQSLKFPSRPMITHKPKEWLLPRLVW